MLMLIKACNAAVVSRLKATRTSGEVTGRSCVGVCLMANGWLECKCGRQGSLGLGLLLKPEQSGKSSLDVERLMSE